MSDVPRHTGGLPVLLAVLAWAGADSGRRRS